MDSYRITSRQLRQMFFDFFSDRGHARISATSIVPEHDPTALFITAGMQPLVPYLLGERHPTALFITADFEPAGRGCNSHRASQSAVDP